MAVEDDLHNFVIYIQKEIFRIRLKINKRILFMNKKSTLPIEQEEPQIRIFTRNNNEMT